MIGDEEMAKNSLQEMKCNEAISFPALEMERALVYKRLE